MSTPARRSRSYSMPKSSIRSNTGRMLMYGMTICLLVLTTYRTIDLVANTISNEGTKWMAIFAVIAIDLGVLAWSFIYRSHAQGSQRVVAISMFVVDLLAVLAAQIGDTALQGEFGDYGSLIEQVSLFVIPLVIVINIGAFALYEILDPENQVRGRLLQAEYDDAIAIAELQQLYTNDLIENRRDAYDQGMIDFVSERAKEQTSDILRDAHGDSQRRRERVEVSNQPEEFRHNGNGRVRESSTSPKE